MKKKKSPATPKKGKSRPNPKTYKTTTEPSVYAVSEPGLAYGVMPSSALKSTSSSRVRSKASPALSSFAVKAGDNLAVVLKASAGVPSLLFFQLADKAAVSKEQLAEKLHLSLKTLTRYRSTASLLDRPTGEHLVRIITLYEKGYEVFGAVSSFNSWMHKPAFGLGGQVPFELIQTPGGTELVTEEVIRIEYGDLA